jgi:hypothetical protein
MDIKVVWLGGFFDKEEAFGAEFLVEGHEHVAVKGGFDVTVSVVGEVLAVGNGVETFEAGEHFKVFAVVNDIHEADVIEGVAIGGLLHVLDGVQGVRIGVDAGFVEGYMAEGKVEIGGFWCMVLARFEADTDESVVLAEVVEHSVRHKFFDAEYHGYGKAAGKVEVLGVTAQW